jgi:hypothetical protein
MNSTIDRVNLIIFSFRPKLSEAKVISLFGRIIWILKGIKIIQRKINLKTKPQSNI